MLVRNEMFMEIYIISVNTLRFVKNAFEWGIIMFFGKRLGSSLGHTLNFSQDLVQYRYRNMYHKEPLTLSSTVILSTS